MLKLLRTMAAVALVGPASFALAEDPAATGAKKAGDAAAEAGKQAVKAGDVAEKAADTAEKAGNVAEKAGYAAEKAGQKAEQAGQKAQKARDAVDEKYAKADAPGVKAARKAIGELERADPSLTRFFNGAAGYAVFPTVGKGAVGVGGAHGAGVVFEKGLAVGKATLTQVTLGLQVGGQTYSEVIFFETEKSLADFKKGEFTMAAQVSAVAATAGASANARYEGGVSVFTLAKKGLMAEASVGGQKFTFHPYQVATTASAR